MVLVRLLHLGFHTAAGVVHVGGEAGVAAVFEELEGGRLRGVAEGDDEDVGVFVCGRHEVLLFKGQQHALEAGRETDGRGRLAADFLDEAVIAAAASHSALGAERRVFDFKRRLRVVVEAAHETRVERK